MLKSKLVREIRGITERRKLTKTGAAAVPGFKQPDVSALVTGRVGKFSIDRLVRCLDRMDYKVDKRCALRLVEERDIGDEMTLDEFRVEMALYRRSADDEAKSLKDPYVTLEKLCALYSKFNDVERRIADQVFREWALSEEEGLRFDALALIWKLKVGTAIPTLHELAARLASSTEPSAPYELKKVHKIVAGLSTSSNAK